MAKSLPAFNAADLIYEAKQERDQLPDGLRDELAKLMRHNAKAPRDKRVSADKAIELCKAFGYAVARGKFGKVIEREFGRNWSGA